MARFTNDELIERLRAVPKGGADIDFDKARAALERQTAKAPLHGGTTTTPVDAGGVPAEWVDPATPPTNGRAVLYLHGGGYVMGSIGSHRALASHLAAAAEARVLLIDYRLAPESPFPAGVDDAVAAWRWMVGPGGADRTRSVIAGDSAGGGLTAATALALKQAGDPAPAGVVCLSPFVDMEATGESHTTKADDDPVVGTDGLKAMVTAYLGSADARDPLASPIHGDWSGAPPMLIQVGTNEVLLDDARMLTKVCRDAGVQVTLEEWDGQVHVFQSFYGLIDDAERAVDRIGEWVKEMTPVKLGLAVGYSGSTLRLPLDLILQAEKAGFDSLWTAEAYGSDAITPLAYLAAKTERLRLGTGIMQLAGRTPAMCAMQCMTVDALAGSQRVIAGLGVSGPQIVEGWYGEPWGKPYWRLRDYIQIMRKIFLREGPVSHEGREISLPYTGEGAIGLGKPLQSILHADPKLPIWLGSGNEATVKLTGELCDGWLPLHFFPGRMDHFRPWVEEGFARARRAGVDRGWHNFEIQAQLPVRITDDVADALRRQKPEIALYVGGMGHPTMNFHNQHMQAVGFPEAAARIQELFLGGRKEEAAAAVPDEYVDQRCLVGPPERIRSRYVAWAESGVTGVNVVTGSPAVVELMAELAQEVPAVGMAQLTA